MGPPHGRSAVLLAAICNSAICNSPLAPANLVFLHWRSANCNSPLFFCMFGDRRFFTGDFSLAILHWRLANCNSPLFSLCSAIDDSAIRRSTILPPAILDFCTGDRRIALFSLLPLCHFFL